jgi:hypothetical protein
MKQVLLIGRMSPMRLQNWNLLVGAHTRPSVQEIVAIASGVRSSSQIDVIIAACAEHVFSRWTIIAHGSIIAWALATISISFYFSAIQSLLVIS